MPLGIQNFSVMICAACRHISRDFNSCCYGIIKKHLTALLEESREQFLHLNKTRTSFARLVRKKAVLSE